jgi:hypothetical protein
MEKFFRILLLFVFSAMVTVVATGCSPFFIAGGSLYNLARYIHDDEKNSGQMQYKEFLTEQAQEKEALQNKPKLPLGAIPGTGYLNTANEWHCLKRGSGILVYRNGKWKEM